MYFDATEGSSIIDVTVLGGRGQGFFDGSTKALVINSVKGEGVSRYVQNSVTSFIDELLV